MLIARTGLAAKVGDALTICSSVNRHAVGWLAEIVGIHKVVVTGARDKKIR